MYIGNLEYFVEVRRNVHARLGHEWALKVRSDIVYHGGDVCWTLFSFDKEPTKQQVIDAISIAHRAMDFYHSNSVKGSFNGAWTSDVDADLQRCREALEYGLE